MNMAKGKQEGIPINSVLTTTTTFAPYVKGADSVATARMHKLSGLVCWFHKSLSKKT